MELPLLSVVMPVHGGERWLDATLTSIETRADAPVEVIIRDSTPNAPCSEIVARHADRLLIDYAYVPETVSWTRKTNRAVEAASAEHVCMLHQDDLWLAGRLEIAAEMIEQAHEAAMLLTSATIVDEAGRHRGNWQPPFAPGAVLNDACRNDLLIQNSIALPAPIFRRDAYLDVGGLDESLWYTPDWDLWLKLASMGAVVYDPRPTVAFRIHRNSLTMTGDREEFAEQLAIVLERHLPRVSPETRICQTSATVNVLLARAAAGEPRAALRAVTAILSLGPCDGMRYLQASRLAERLLPRLRMRLSGGL